MPSDTAFVVGRAQLTRDSSDGLERAMFVTGDERQLLRDEILGAVAKICDAYLARPTSGKYMGRAAS